MGMEPEMTEMEPEMREMEPDMTEMEPEMTEMEPEMSEMEPEMSKVEVVPSTKRSLMEPAQCSMCISTASLSCARCNCSLYCSHECRDADWRTHKVICKQWLSLELSGFTTPPRPSSRRAIFFPAGTDTPKFVWVTTDWIPARVDENTPGFERIDFKPFLGADVVNCIQIWANAIRSRRRIDDHIQLFHRREAIIDGSRRNRTISRLTYRTFEFYPWYGSVLAMRSPNSSELDPDISCTHMDPGDFRDLIDLFCSYNSGYDMNDMNYSPRHKGPDSPVMKALNAKGELHPNDPAVLIHSLFTEYMSKFPSVQGVRINCLSDMYARGRDMYEDVEVSVNDLIMGNDVHPTIVSELVDFPVRTRRIRPMSDDDEANNPAAFLHLDPDHPGENWREAFPTEWRRFAGSVLVVHDRPFQFNISAKKVKRLCSFCMDFVHPCMEMCLEDPENLKLREKLLRSVVTRRAFLQFCGKFDHVHRSAAEWPWEDESAAGMPTMTNLTIKFRKFLQL